MKAQKQVSKLEATASIFDNLKTIILTVIGLALFIGLIIAFINSQIKNSNLPMTISEAQEKCMLMEEADLVNTMGEPFGSETTKKAEKTCLAGWDRSINPEKTDEAFINIIATDWENRKSEILEGYTLEQLYNQAHSN
jgi:hypothetical protein